MQTSPEPQSGVRGAEDLDLRERALAFSHDPWPLLATEDTPMFVHVLVVDSASCLLESWSQAHNILTTSPLPK